MVNLYALFLLLDTLATANLAISAQLVVMVLFDQFLMVADCFGYSVPL